MTWKLWAVVRNDGQINPLDSFGTNRLAVYATRKEARLDCDPTQERVVRIVAQPARKA